MLHLRQSKIVTLFLNFMTTYTLVSASLVNLAFATSELFVTVETDKPSYLLGELVEISGIVTDSTGTPIGDAAIGIEVIDSRDNTIFLDGIYSSDYGYYEDSFRLSTSAPLGKYGVFVTANKAGYSPAMNQTSFYVLVWYIKPPYPDYAPSGMPDFDQRQWGTYNWTDASGAWSHCGPVACANSLWWLDSEFEPNPIPTPTINDGFSLLQAYGPWDDHDPQNVPPLVEHLAWLMDCDGRRTGQSWLGTYVNDMEAGLAQYLSWSGVNPLGDVNGDAVVNQTDIDIVDAAMGSTPGSPNWNLAADIFPATTTYPPTTDNIINASDLARVNDHLNETGMFHEHTEYGFENSEFFYVIEEEVERCQDVVLLLGFYDAGTDNRTGGHYVTVAGGNSNTLELLISNPIRDDFEDGNTPGRSPVPHSHPSPEPPYVTHNNASLVSQDAYNTTLMPSPSGYPWLLEGYFPPEYSLEARIEYAVITSPRHDVAVTNVAPSKTIVGQGYDANITVTVENQGNFTETFTVTTYANTTILNQTQITLPSLSSTNFAFTWNTTDFAKGNYTITAKATILLGETDTTDNTLTDGWVVVTIPGDIDGDYDVDRYDFGIFGMAYGSKPGDANWNPNSDIDSDDDVDRYDFGIFGANYGKTDP